MSESCPREATSAMAASKMRCARSRTVSSAYREWLLLLYADFALFRADDNDDGSGLVGTSRWRSERSFTVFQS